MTCLGVCDAPSLPIVSQFFGRRSQRHRRRLRAWRRELGEALPLRARGRFGQPPTALQLVTYGNSVTVAGYSQLGGSLPGRDTAVQLRKVVSGGTAPGGSDTTDAQGYYEVVLKPRANAVWTAVLGDAATEQRKILVAPKVTLTLSHLKPSGTRLVEVFTGSVAPRHAGTRVLVQKASGSKWRTVASGKLDRRSRYRVAWRCSTNRHVQVATVVPRHSDHAQGASTVGALRVVVKKR